MAKAIRNRGTAGVSRRAGGGKVAEKMPTPIAETKGQASINDGKQPSKERLQQLKKDRERTAAILKHVAHHREALLGSLEPSVLGDRKATRNGILRLGRRWFHGKPDAARQAFFAGKRVSLDVGVCPLEPRGAGALRRVRRRGSAASCHFFFSIGVEMYSSGTCVWRRAWAHHFASAREVVKEGPYEKLPGPPC